MFNKNQYLKKRAQYLLALSNQNKETKDGVPQTESPNPVYSFFGNMLTETELEEAREKGNKAAEEAYRKALILRKEQYNANKADTDGQIVVAFSFDYVDSAVTITPDEDCMKLGVQLDTSDLLTEVVDKVSPTEFAKMVWLSDFDNRDPIGYLEQVVYKLKKYEETFTKYYELLEPIRCRLTSNSIMLPPLTNKQQKRLLANEEKIMKGGVVSI